MLNLMISAGEVSGDKNAAMVVSKVKEMFAGVKVWGLGGSEMAREGVEILHNPVDNSIVGFWEPIMRLGYYLKLLAHVKKEIIRRKPDVILLVDFTSFNMRLAKFGNMHKIPVISYFSPSAWVWGPWRAQQMARWQAVIAAVNQMEYQIYQNAGAKVHFVGHPLPDMVNNRVKTDLSKFIPSRTGHRLIGLLPGSRRQEINSLLGCFINAAEIIHQKYPDTIFAIPAAAPHLKNTITNIIQNTGTDLPLTLLDGMSLDVIDEAQVILTASGTVTLEAACTGTPFVAAYRVSLLTSILIKLLVKARFMSLPNIILGKEVFPEFYQDRVTPDALASAVIAILDDKEYAASLRQKLVEVVDGLGEGCPAGKTAQLIADMAGKRGVLNGPGNHNQWAR